MARNGDPEIKAMNALANTLGALDEPTRDRVLAWANAKWGKRVEEFATLLPSVERVAENHREPLQPIGKEQRRG
jgi:hypothetical protein